MLVLNLVLIALAISLEPIPLTAFILVLASAGGFRKGVAFICGWLASLAIVIFLTVAVTGNNPPRVDTAPSRAALAVKILIGAVLVVIALRRWRRLGQPKPPKRTPKWQAGIDHMSPWFAMALGPLTQPWGLVAAGVAVIAGAELSRWQDSLALFAYCVVATGPYLVLQIYAGIRPDRTRELLTRTKSWIDTHRDQLVIVVSFGIGVWLVVGSVSVVLA